MPEVLLDVVDVTAGYGGAPILQGVNLQVRDGHITAIVGPNGAGKSTFLKTLTGELIPSAGIVTFQGTDITKLSTEKRASLGLGYVPQIDNVFPSLTIRENLEMGGYVRRSRISQNLERVFGIFPDLHMASSRRAGTLSGGQRNMLALGRALMGEPAALLLDEPTAGLAPKYVDAVWDHIIEICQQGISILIVEQNTRRALKVSDWAFVLVLGRNGPSGPGPELLANQEISDLYIGGGSSVAKSAAANGLH